jgi:DNA-binding GntR family transcriptional regulator
LWQTTKIGILYDHPILGAQRMQANELYGAKEQTPKPRATRADDAYQRLRADILCGALPPGHKLKFDVMQSDLGYSASPLREALTRLTSDGLVTSEHHRGFTVAEISYDELKDITRLRCLLEPLAFKESIAEGDDAWEADLLSAFHRLSKIEERVGSEPNVPDDNWAFWHKKFHDTLLASCPSVKLLQIRTNLFEQSERYRFLSAARRKTTRDKLKEHKQLMDAALERDADKACKLMEDHIMLTAEHLIAALKKEG